MDDLPTPLMGVFTTKNQQIQHRKYKINLEQQQLQERKRIRPFQLNSKTSNGSKQQNNTISPFSNLTIRLKMKSFDKSFDHFNLREIRKERQKIAEELSRTFNQSKYYEHRQKQQQKTIEMLIKKQRKINLIRRLNFSQKKQFSRKIRNIYSEDYLQKKKIKEKINYSRINLQQSRRKLELSKTILANQVYRMKQQERVIIEKDKQDWLKKNRKKYQAIKQYERKASLHNIQVAIQKKQLIKAKKSEKIEQQLKSQQKLQILSRKVVHKLNQKISSYRINIDAYKSRACQIRKRLGQRTFDLKNRFQQNKRVNTFCCGSQENCRDQSSENLRCFTQFLSISD